MQPQYIKKPSPAQPRERGDTPAVSCVDDQFLPDDDFGSAQGVPFFQVPDGDSETGSDTDQRVAPFYRIGDGVFLV